MKRWHELHVGFCAMHLHALARRQQPAVLRLRRLPRGRERRAAAAAAACRAALPSPTCRAAPATCGWRATSAPASLPWPSRPRRVSSGYVHAAELACRRRPGCRSAARAARSGTCSRRDSRSSRLRSSRTRLSKNSFVSVRITSARLLVEVRIEVRIRMDLVDVLQAQPLRREARRRAPRRADRRACGAPAARGRRSSTARLRPARGDQLLVGRRAPEEERQPRREVDVGDAIGAARARVGRRLLEAEDEVRARENRFERRAHAALEAALRRAALVERHAARSISRGVSGRRYASPPSCVTICRAHGALFGGDVGRQREDLLAARRRRDAGRLDRARG